MKKPSLIITAAIVILSLTAFSYINWKNTIPVSVGTIVKIDDSNFTYNVGPRFDGVTKTELNKAVSVLDFLDDRQAPPVVSFESVTINIVADEWPTGVRAKAKDDRLTDRQQELLRSADYSTNFSVRGECNGINQETGALEHTAFNPYLTIVPETQAIYIEGNETLLKYLRVNNRKHLDNLESNKIRPAMLNFVVNKDGSISNVEVRNHSGYPEMDKTMMELIQNTSGKWTAAENAEGEKVEQQLVIFFGMDGC